MTREAYQRSLKELEADVLAMGAMVKKAVKDSVTSLQARDIAKSKELIANDILINRKRFEIEDRCLQIIATQQPMAGDLRVLAATLNIVTDLERIADHAEGNAQINVLI
ncbi:MAG: PhoU domain-containing protein, partial [Thermodesulfobacteriota bacterium]